MPGATDSSELENLAPCLPESCLEISATELKRTALWYLCWSKQQGRRQERGNLLPVGSQDRHFWWGAIYSHAQLQRLEGANQVLGVGHSRQRKELIKRLFWGHKPATDGVTDGRRERRIIDTPTASLHVTQPTRLRVYTHFPLCLEPLPSTHSLPPQRSLLRETSPDPPEKNQTPGVNPSLPVFPQHLVHATVIPLTTWHSIAVVKGLEAGILPHLSVSQQSALERDSGRHAVSDKWVSDHIKRGMDKLNEGTWNSAMVTTH